jgi:hypothetical protein
VDIDQFWTSFGPASDEWAFFYRPLIRIGGALRSPDKGARSSRASDRPIFGEDAFTRVGDAGGPDRTTRAFAFSLSLAA